MRFGKREVKSRARRMMALASLSLAVGLLMVLFMHPASAAARNWVDGMSGMLIGVSLGVNLFRLRWSRNCSVTEVEKS